MADVAVWHASCIVTMQAYGSKALRIREVGKMTIEAIELLIEASVIIAAGIMGFGPLVVGA